jgi:sulfite reductase beta subunit-like hemoprotein
MPKPAKPESKVEVAKRPGGSSAAPSRKTLASDATHFGPDDVHLLKFHGTYQQDSAGRAAGPAGWRAKENVLFMVRVAIPAGAVTAEQYLALDSIADRHASGTLRVTTRRGSSSTACSGKPQARHRRHQPGAAHRHRRLRRRAAERDGLLRAAGRRRSTAVRAVAEALAVELRPASRAYHEIWLDGEKQVSTEEEEPFYGTQYLPRKFKTAVGLSNDNCVDIWAQDVGLLAIVEAGRIQGFNLLVGGGMGMTHHKADTTARLAEPLGFIPTAHGVEAVRIVAAIFRDAGNRADRRHARLKYLLAEWGIDRFRQEFRRRASFETGRRCRSLAAARPPRPAPAGDERWFYGVFVQSGRITDRGARLKTACTRSSTLSASVHLTAQQNLLLTDLDLAGLDAINGCREHGVTPATSSRPRGDSPWRPPFPPAASPSPTRSARSPRCSTGSRPSSRRLACGTSRSPSA